MAFTKCDLNPQLKKWETIGADESKIQRKFILTGFDYDSPKLVRDESGSHRGRCMVFNNGEPSDCFCGGGNEKSRVPR